jgi:hypothetical protein
VDDAIARLAALTLTDREIRDRLVEELRFRPERYDVFNWSFYTRPRDHELTDKARAALKEMSVTGCSVNKLVGAALKRARATWPTKAEFKLQWALWEKRHGERWIMAYHKLAYEERRTDDVVILPGFPPIPFA